MYYLIMSSCHNDFQNDSNNNNNDDINIKINELSISHKSKRIRLDYNYEEYYADDEYSDEECYHK